ncbi:hypothetical protein MMC12_004168 [Toensbergia leucococca]|nr:hypothetical protein [Toensbergia leucococca]
MTTWNRIWCGQEPFSSHVYQFFWGDIGFEDIQSRLQDIHSLAEDIKLLITEPSIRDASFKNTLSSRDTCDSGSGELREWKNITNQLETIPFAQLRNVKPFFKLKYAFYKSNSLREYCTQLKEHVQSLGTYSQHLLRERQKGAASLPVTNEELQELEHWKALICRTRSFAQDLFSATDDPGNRFFWALELEEPTSQVELDARIRTDHLNLFIRYDDTHGLRRAARIRIDHAPEHDMQDEVGAVWLAIRIREVLLSEDIPLQRDERFRFLPKPLGRSRRLRTLLVEGVFDGLAWKHYELDRSSIAFALVYWTLLLWGTPWIVNPCTCAMHCLMFDGSAKREYSFNPCRPDKHTGSKCHSGDVCHPQLFLLGLVVAEVIIGEPLSLLDVKSPKPISKRGVSVTIDDLLKDISRVTHFHPFVTAVKYCLSSSASDDEEPFLNVYIDAILVP